MIEDQDKTPPSPASLLRRVCFSLDVRGALKVWTDPTWIAVASEIGLSAADLRARFRKWEGEGILQIPIGKRCELFDDAIGCPGHPAD